MPWSSFFGSGWTNPATSVTVMNRATLDSSNFNTISYNTFGGYNCFYYIARTDTVPGVLVANSCDHATPTFVDMDSNVADIYFPYTNLPSSNTTGGMSVAFAGSLPNGFGVNGNWNLFNPLVFPAGFGLTTGVLWYLVGPFGSELSRFAADSTGGQQVLSTGGGSGDLFFNGWGQRVATATSAATYHITRNDGFIKCDSSGGNVTIVLPDTSTFPAVQGGNGSWGRVFTVHKPVAANSCTLQSNTGDLIDGLSTYVLSTQHDSVTVYWDADGDGNTPIWATSGRIPYDKVLPAPFTFANLGTPSNGVQKYCTDCTVTSGSDNTCAASGSGANAFRINGAWKCVQ
jgi:hypothetical protein